MAKLTTNTSYKAIMIQKIYDFDATDPVSCSYNKNDMYPFVRITFQSSGIDLTNKVLVFENTNPAVLPVEVEADDLNQYIDLYYGSIPADTVGYLIDGILENGNDYLFYIKVVDGNTTIKSNVQQFSCHKNQELSLEIENEAHNGSVTARFSYLHSEGIAMHEYRCILKKKLSTTNLENVLDTGNCYGYGISISTDEGSMANIEQKIQELEDSTTYEYVVYTRAGSQNGALISISQEFAITIKKEEPSETLKLENDQSRNGRILVSAQIKKVTGEKSDALEDAEDVFIGEEVGGITNYEMADLRPDGYEVSFKENFNVTTGTREFEPVFCFDVKDPSVFEPCCVISEKWLEDYGYREVAVSCKSRIDKYVLDVVDDTYTGFMFDFTTLNSSSIYDPDIVANSTTYVSALTDSADESTTFDPKRYYFEARIYDRFGTIIKSNELLFPSQGAFEDAMIRVVMKFTSNPNAYSLEAHVIDGEGGTT